MIVIFDSEEEKNLKTLNEWAAEIHENAVAHGWWDEERSFGDIVALCHSELSEALEEYRKRRPMVYCEGIETNAACSDTGENACSGTECLACFNGRKPEGVAVEVLDCVIRILDWCGKEGVDVDKLLAAKHEYNKGRPYRHGGKAL